GLELVDALRDDDVGDRDGVDSADVVDDPGVVAGRHGEVVDGFPSRVGTITVLADAAAAEEQFAGDPERSGDGDGEEQQPGGAAAEVVVAPGGGDEGHPEERRVEGPGRGPTGDAVDEDERGGEAGGEEEAAEPEGAAGAASVESDERVHAGGESKPGAERIRCGYKGCCAGGFPLDRAPGSGYVSLVTTLRSRR